MKLLVSATADSLMMVRIVEDAPKATPETPIVEIADLLKSVPIKAVMLPATATEHANKEVTRPFVLATQASSTTVSSSVESAPILSLSILTVS